MASAISSDLSQGGENAAGVALSSTDEIIAGNESTSSTVPLEDASSSDFSEPAPGAAALDAAIDAAADASLRIYIVRQDAEAAAMIDEARAAGDALFAAKLKENADAQAAASASERDAALDSIHLGQKSSNEPTLASHPPPSDQNSSDALAPSSVETVPAEGCPEPWESNPTHSPCRKFMAEFCTLHGTDPRSRFNLRAADFCASNVLPGRYVPTRGDQGQDSVVARYSIRAKQRWLSAFSKINFCMAFYLWNLKCIHKKEVNKRLQVASHTLKLDASGIGIKNIPENVFLLRQLKAVWLHENQIFKVPPEIGDLKEVTQIRLFSNNLKFLPAEIGQLRTLQVLWLQKNDLICLPKELGLCTNLTILNISQNSRLTQLPIELNTLKDLKQFTLDPPVFHFPPTDVASRSPTMIIAYLKRYADARKTHILDLHASNSTSVPYMLYELLPSLTAIHAVSCRIPTLPPQLGLCTNITELKFDRSVLLSPPQGIVNRGTKDILKFLYGLHAAQISNIWILDNVGLDGVPSEISVLTALTALDISENRVKVLPGSLIACSELVNLRASKNEIDQLDDFSLYQSLQSIDISHNSIKSLPPSLFSLPAIQTIDAGFNKLKSVPKQISCCSSMSRLILSKNILTSLPDTWQQCVNLVHLDISDNKLKRLPYTLGFAPLLKQFIYQNNPLESPPVEVLQADNSEVTLRYLYRIQTALQTLSLDASSFGFVNVHSDIFVLTQLLELNLANNELTNLPSELSLMTELKMLLLSSNAFNVVPPVLTTLEDLTELDLSGNFLVKLPAQLGFLRKMRKLNVEGNPLKEPPLEVARRGMQAIITFLKALGALPLTAAAVLSHQSLRKFPVAVLELGERCTEIDFSSNHLNALPSKFGNMLPALKTLNFSYNQITQLPQSIECLAKLQVLNMTANALLAIPDVIARCISLRRLLLASNAPLQEIPSSIGNLTALVEIQASNCSLHSLPIQIGRLVQLETLGFSYNLVEVLPPTLVRCEALTDLNFASNKVQTLPPWLGDLPLLQKCRFESNPLIFPSGMIQPRGHEFVMKYLLLFKAARLTKVLELIRMEFTQIPPEISPQFVGGFSLVALRLDFNPIKHIPDAIYRLHTLAELSIANTKLKAVSEDVLLLTNLTLLQLHSNHLRYVSPKLGFMTHLQRLSLSGNRKLLSPPSLLWPYPTPVLLDYFRRNMAAAETCVLDWNNLKLGDVSIMPKEVASFSNLVSLSLDNFGLSDIDLDVFSKMMFLERLSLSHNYIQSFSVAVMSTLTSLTFLDLQYNRVKLLPWFFFQMTRLVNLKIGNNPIESPPHPVCFSSTLEVKRFCQEMWSAQIYARTIMPDGTTSQEPATLRLTNFELREICREVWEVPHLTHLDISRNSITVIPDAITKLRELSTVNISKNNLSVLESWLPIKLVALCDFDFSCNSVTLLVPLWAHATNLTRLNSLDNPITVPCAEILHRTCYELRLFFAHILCVCEGLPLHACYAEHAYPEDAVGIKRVPVQTVDSAPPLHGILSLPNFGLTAYFPEWSHFTVLYSLSLHGNQLTDWPPSLEKLGVETLFAIDLRRNKIANMSSTINQLRVLRYIYAQSNCIVNVPDELWLLPCIDSIFLMDNNISNLSPSAAHCSSLRTLDVSGNEITAIPRDFGLASHLPSFTWERNPLEEPPSCVIDRGWDFTRNLFKSVIDALETLALSLPNFGLDQLVSDTQDLSQITELNLSQNIFPAIPKALFNWSQMTKVNISNNAIKELPAAIVNWNKLIDLNVSHNVIPDIPAGITSIITLNCFRASNNVIEIIPAGLGLMPELMTLDLNSNKITFAPSDLCRSTSITFLGLDSNPMRSPPISIIQQGLRPVFFFLKCVDTAGSSGILDLRGLNMESLDYEVLPLQNVKKILLQDNQITQLASEVMQSGIVEEIRLDNNPLNHLDPKVVAEMYLMRSLSLQGSALSALPSNMSSMMDLTFLDVTGNRLNALPASLVQLQLLETLRASKNLLECLPNNMRNMTSLKILELNDNRLVLLPMELGILPRLTRCLIANNPIQIPNPAIMNLGVAIMFEYMCRVWDASTKTFSLDLSGLNLDDVPSEVLVCTTITDLRLEHSGLLRVPPLLAGMISLQQLWLARNNITCFPAEICHLTCLHRLRLSFNQIPLIPEEISSLTKLRELWLDSNPISVIPVGVGRLTNLTLLRIDSHRLTSPPASIANSGPESVIKYLSGLICAVQSGTLDLSNMCMMEFPAEIWGLKDCLTSLLLQSNYFEKIPSSVSLLTCLTHLDVTGCPIVEIPLAIGAMSNLTSIAVSGGHRLKNPPPEVSEQGSTAILRFMQNMNHANLHGLLDLQDMQLRSLPAAVFAVPGLVELQVQDNLIVELPDDLSAVQNLKFLRLERCPIQQLPDEVMFFTRLRTLRVNGCRLFTLPPSFGRMTNLKRFSAPDNSIQSILDESLIGLSNLQKLNLDRNALVTLPGTVSCLVSLRKLRVCSNQLASVPVACGQMSSLTTLALTCNMLSTLPDEPPCRLTHVSELGLDEFGRWDGGLMNLTSLHLSANQLRIVPRCVQLMPKLRILWVCNNMLFGLPAELAKLIHLVELEADGNVGMQFPPASVLLHGLSGIMQYLGSNSSYEKSIDSVGREADPIDPEATRKPYVSHYLSVREENFDNMAINFSEKDS